MANHMIVALWCFEFDRVSVWVFWILDATFITWYRPQAGAMHISHSRTSTYLPSYHLQWFHLVAGKLRLRLPLFFVIGRCHHSYALRLHVSLTFAFGRFLINRNELAGVDRQMHWHWTCRCQTRQMRRRNENQEAWTDLFRLRKLQIEHMQLNELSLNKSKC